MVVVAFPVWDDRDLIAAVARLDVPMCGRTCRDAGSWHQLKKQIQNCVLLREDFVKLCPSCEVGSARFDSRMDPLKKRPELVFGKSINDRCLAPIGQCHRISIVLVNTSTSFANQHIECYTLHNVPLTLKPNILRAFSNPSIYFCNFTRATYVRTLTDIQCWMCVRKTLESQTIPQCFYLAKKTENCL